MKHFKIRQSITDRSSISTNLYLKDIAKIPILTEQEEKSLLLKAKQGDEKAKKKLVESNLRFVVSIAKQYQNKGVPLEDLISVGNIGLIEAVNKFNLDYDCRFLSYAIWWIRDYILKEIFTNGKAIKVPIGKVNSIIRFNRIVNEYEQNNERFPSVEEIMEMSGWTEEEVNNLMFYSQMQVCREENANAEGETASIYDNTNSEEFLIEENTNKESLRIDVINSLKTALNPIEYQVIINLFHLTDKPKALEDLSAALGLTKERIRQIKDKAIIKLRHSSAIEQLQKYL